MLSGQSDIWVYDKLRAPFERRQKLVVVLFFVLFFITSVIILKDFGLSWDEAYQWKDNGEVVYNYVFNGETDALLRGNERYHGPAFELALVLVQKALNLTDTRDVYLMRHFLTFLTFFISVIFFYYLCKRCFKSWKLSLIGCIFLVLSPRIFADSFYNSKDPILLSFFIIGMVTLLKFHYAQTYKNAVLHALVCALAIDTRILGIILPVTSLGFIAIDGIIGIITKKRSNNRYASIGVFVIFLIGLIILFWPVLWEDPVFHFKAALVEMSKYHWNDRVLYTGTAIRASELPWHYLPVWICISTPVSYLLFFFVGFFFVIKQLVTQPVDFPMNQKQYLLMLIWFFFPLVLIIVFKSVVYDAWRHVFFIYPAFILIALCGLRFLRDTLFKKRKLVLSIIVTCIVIFNFMVMVHLHPHENIYFNFLAGKDMKAVKKNFELDYYGISSKQALEYILRNDPSLKLNICAEQYPQWLNVQYLPMEQRNRIRIVDLEYADYIICQYRFHNNDYDFKHEFFSVKVGNARIMSVFKLTDLERKIAAPKGQVKMKLYANFENQLSGVSHERIFEPPSGAHTGRLVTMTDSINQFSDSITFKIPEIFCNKKNLVLKITYWKYEELGSESNLVVQIKNSIKPYFWNASNSKAVTGTIKKWDQASATVQLPAVTSPTDIVSVFLWNIGKKQLLMDDVEVELLEKQGEQFKIDYRR
jgi:hypothetical protein